MFYIHQEFPFDRSTKTSVRTPVGHGTLTECRFNPSNGGCRRQRRSGSMNNQGRQYDVAPDGRFLIVGAVDDVVTPITLLQNWHPPEK
jgi:hypothetical protein